MNYFGGVKIMKKIKALSLLILPLLVLASCNDNKTNSTAGNSNNSSINSNNSTSQKTTDSTTPEPEKDVIEVISTTTEVEVGGQINIRVRVNKDIADRTVNFSFKNTNKDKQIMTIKKATKNVLSGVVACTIEGKKAGTGTLVISMHDSTQTETKELAINVVTKLNTPDRVWNTIAEKDSYTFTAKPADESKVTASNTTITRVTKSSVVVTDGNNDAIKVDANKINSTYRINGGLSYSNSLNLGGFPMDKDGNAFLEGTTDEDKGFTNKSVLTNYFNGDLADVYGITLDKNGNAMYIAKNKKTNEFYNNLQAFKNDAGYVNSKTLSGLGTSSYSPANYLTYYGNNSVRTSGDIYNASGFYGFKAVNSSWLSFTKDYSNVYDLVSSAPSEIDSTSTDDSVDYMSGMKKAYAKILIWNMMSPTTFVPALINFIGNSETSFRWSDFAALVDVSITVIDNSNLSISLSGTSDLTNYYSDSFPELIGTVSDVSSTSLSSLTDVNTFVSRTDLEATKLSYSTEFENMVSYINNAVEYKITYYSGSSISFDVYWKENKYLFYDYSTGYLELLREEYPTENLGKVGYVADADGKAWEVLLNDDYTVSSVTTVKLNDGTQADYSTLEAQLSTNVYAKKQTSFKLNDDGSYNEILNTFSQTKMAPFSGYDAGYVSYSPLAQVSIFSDYWTNITASENSYGSWITILAPTSDADGNITSVSMSRALSQGDSSSYSIWYPNAISCTREGEALNSMADGLKTVVSDILGKHTTDINY